MPNVKILLTTYKSDSKEDEVQALFNCRCELGEFVDRALVVFDPCWKLGLDWLSYHLSPGTGKQWWRHPQAPQDFGYEAVRTVGMYQGVKEPSLCVDLDLVDQTRAGELIKIAARFGREFNQTSVHVLFSLRTEEAKLAWNGQNSALGTLGRPADVHLLTTQEAIPSPRILEKSRECSINALTIHFFSDQLQYHYPVSEQGNSRWANLVASLIGIPLKRPVETWEALLFAVGSGPECTSRYDDWLAPELSADNRA